MQIDLHGKSALVLGGSDGIGKAIAQVFIASGATVAIAARQIDKLNLARDEIGASLAVPCDLSKKNSGADVVHACLAKFKKLDILVTNTGGPARGFFEEISKDAWYDGYQSLWMSVVESIQTALPNMKKNMWGRIILITSTAAKEPIPALTISNSLRAGLLGLANSLSREVAEYGITVNAILPGFINTERLKELQLSHEKIISQIPAKRIAEPEEVGFLAAYLASDQARYLTGQAITLDGGRSLGI